MLLFYHMEGRTTYHANHAYTHTQSFMQLQQKHTLLFLDVCFHKCKPARTTVEEDNTLPAPVPKLRCFSLLLFHNLIYFQVQKAAERRGNGCQLIT